MLVFAYGRIAQLVRALASHARGHGFESPCVHQNSGFAAEKTAIERFFSYQKKIYWSSPARKLPVLAAAAKRRRKVENAMKKRWVAALAAAMLCMTMMSACGEGFVDMNASSQTSSEAVSSALTEDEVEDTLGGLEQFMLDRGYIAGTPSEMDGELIGAKELGHRYVSGSITAEFYEYDLDNLNETANTVRDSVQKDGAFQIIGQTVPNVYLSDSGKYLMIYNNTATDEASAAKTQEAIEAFKTFKADA